MLSLEKLHKFTKLKIKAPKFVKKAVLETLNTVEIDLMENLSGRKIAKVPHRAALTSHFENF